MLGICWQRPVNVNDVIFEHVLGCRWLLVFDPLSAGLASGVVGPLLRRRTRLLRLRHLDRVEIAIFVMETFALGAELVPAEQEIGLKLTLLFLQFAQALFLLPPALIGVAVGTVGSGRLGVTLTVS